MARKRTGYLAMRQARRAIARRAPRNYSLARDRSRTNKRITRSARTWASNPRRYDMRGVDTKRYQRQYLKAKRKYVTRKHFGK